MHTFTLTSPRRATATAAATFALAALLVASTGQAANAVALPVPLGTAAGFAVLASTTVTNTGLTAISGDIGVNPGSAVVGFPPGIQTAGAAYIADPVSLQARTDASNAFTSASGQAGPTNIPVELGGTVRLPDLYESGGAFTINGTLTLDGGGDPAAIFIFRSASTLITGSASTVTLINQANPCNVFWIVASSATLGTTSTISGTILSATSISAATGTTVNGRLLALNGAVTLDATTVTSTGCSAVTVNPGTGITIEAAATATAAAEAARLAAEAAARLAATGVESDAALWVGGGALLAGGFMVLLGSRRRSRSGSHSLRA